MNTQNLFSSDTTAADSAILDSLNPAQKAAVLHDSGPLLVIAGAGSGKTRTLVHRMAYLIAHGAVPESILLLTFTRKAAQNMLWRAAQLIGSGCRRVMGGTFHAVANLLLRQYGHHIDIGSRFSIIDRADAEGIINLLRSSLGVAGAGKNFPSKRLILNLISGAVNKNMSLEEALLSGPAHLVEFLDDIEAIAEHYHQFKLDHGLMDYDDLLLNWQRLLAESETARDALSARFRHVLVDEYQDTNHIQANIVRLLTARTGNVMAVGDDAQSIYSFRGADFANIMRFEEEFPGARLVLLEQNYRSTKPILELGNDIIAHAREKFDKTLFTENTQGELPELSVCASETAEARFVVGRIRQLVEDGVPLSAIAVLFRSARHSFKLEIELNALGLPFEKRGGLKLTESAHIKDLLSFFRVIVNPQDSLSWNRLLLQLEKVGPKTAHKIVQHISEAEAPLQALSEYPTKAAWKGQLRSLCACLNDIQDEGISPLDQFDRVMDYYQPLFERLYFDDYPRRSRDLDQVRLLLASYGDLRTFVDDTALDPPDAEAMPTEHSGQRLVLSTIHSAKGLEWDTVFVIGLANGRFPAPQVMPGPQWEEERRLFYVAVTRARRQLVLSFPSELLTSDQRNVPAGMSPFVAELAPRLYASTAFPAAVRPAAGALQSEDLPDDGAALLAEELHPGMRVEHAFFGLGTIKSQPASGKVEVFFDRHGRKLLHLAYARLTRLE